MLSRFARPVEIVLGALFVASAASKALNVYGFAVQVAAYGVVRDPALTLAIAHAMVALEALLGAALLGAFRFGGLTAAATAALLVGFTGLIAYAWAFKGLADCGCFGEYVKMGPGTSIAKNVVMLAMTAAAWRGTHRSTAPPANAEADAPTEAQQSPGRAALAIAGALLVAAAFAKGKPAPKTDAPLAPTNGPSAAAGPFAQFVPDLGGAPVPLAQGEYLVAMLSASCDHCRASAQVLNDLTQAPGVPHVAALMMGTDDEMADFRTTIDPQFPIQTIDTLQFMDLLGDATAPPCFYVIRDGTEVRHLIVEDPTYEQLLEFATQGGPAPAENKQ